MADSRHPPSSPDPDAPPQPLAVRSRSRADLARPSLPQSADYNLRILWPIGRYLHDKLGADALAAVAASADLSVSDFDGATKWASWEQFEAVFAASRELVGSDAAFTEACAYRMAETYGPLRFISWAIAPRFFFRPAEKTSRFFSSVGAFKVLDDGPNFAKLEWRSKKPESRLFCLSRQAQSSSVPTLWGLPPAFVREGKCIARGDDACEYEFYWYNRKLWLTPMLATAAGVAVMLAARGAVPTEVAWWSIPLLGATLGFLYELVRTERANARTSREVTEALRAVVREEADARRELLDLHQRQKAWTNLLEEEAAQRASMLRKVTEGIESLQQARETAMLGFSHDLRNPLAVIRSSAEILKEEDLPAPVMETVRDLDQASEQMQRMIAELMRVVTTQRGFHNFNPQRMEVGPLTDRLRRRLRALVHGREIRATVFSTRDAPDAIQVDPLVFDRVVDNLLVNAGKYTERGSIVVEVDGNGEFLVIKISDSGRGIPEGDIEKIFSAGGSDAGGRARDSFGVGLSVVVSLLDHVGGQLEVLSRPGQGTTFWVHFPVNAPAATRVSERPSARNAHEALSRVLRVRKVPA